jgi:hypothetical protein
MNPHALFFRSSRNVRYCPVCTSFFLAILALVFGWPHPVSAQTLGDMLESTAGNLSPLATLFDALAYIAGGVLIGQGLLQLKNHFENPGNNPVAQSMAKMAGGSALMALPFVASTLVATLHLGAGDSTIDGVSSTGGPGLDGMVANFVSNIEGPLIDLLSITAILMGIFLIIRGLIKGAKYGTDPRSSSVPNIATHLVIGSILIVAGQSLSTMVATLFGDSTLGDSSTVLAWAQSLDTSGTFGTAVTAALTFFQLIGMIAFVRGWYIVKNAVEGTGQATVAQGFTHIIGGVLAINIYSFLEIMDQTFGTNFLT